jgi:tetratricopeptide (TPR) repeat protein
MDLDMGRFKSARACVERYLEHHPEDAEAHYLLGEISREDDQADAMAAAEQAYRQSIRWDAGHAEAHRGLGLIFYKSGRNSEALEEFQRYLDLMPAALDRAYIEQYIQQLTSE